MSQQKSNQQFAVKLLEAQQIKISLALAHALLCFN